MAPACVALEQTSEDLCRQKMYQNGTLAPTWGHDSRSSDYANDGASDYSTENAYTSAEYTNDNFPHQNQWPTGPLGPTFGSFPENFNPSTADLRLSGATLGTSEYYNTASGDCANDSYENIRSSGYSTQTENPNNSLFASHGSQRGKHRRYRRQSECADDGIFYHYSSDLQPPTFGDPNHRSCEYSDYSNMCLSPTLSDHSISFSASMSLESLSSSYRQLEDLYTFSDKLLGSGTYGQVYQGTRKDNQTEVAIKIIDKRLDERKIICLSKEVTMLSECRHNNIVSLLDFLEAEENFAMVMELCAGGDLFDYLQQEVFLEEDLCAKITKEIALGLEYLHHNRIAHRDLKVPSSFVT
eukprot:TRINITY_DN4643_c1_g1_i1.p1 TRINITY_DN4643_c1_g1~~TRINITY_DN4643_c1_g1_i1.p1  ORF type:complete len:397 (-),score=19.40 TRINITY_DN4643_c1_g1_i1:104-1168(-)